MDVTWWLSLRYRNVRQSRLQQQRLLCRLSTRFYDWGSCWTGGVGAVPPPSICQRQLGQLRWSSERLYGPWRWGQQVVTESQAHHRKDQLISTVPCAHHSVKGNWWHFWTRNGPLRYMLLSLMGISCTSPLIRNAMSMVPYFSVYFFIENICFTVFLVLYFLQSSFVFLVVFSRPC